MGVTQIIALVVVVILAAVVLTLTWRAMRWAIRTRHVLLFRQIVADLTDRSEALLDGISERVDKVRRSVEAGGELLPELAASKLAAEALATESRAVHGPVATDQIVSGIVGELERAARAIEMVEYGCTILGQERGREHDPEAQTAIKRGYLNLLHARENIALHAAAAAALPVTIPRLPSRRAPE